MTTSSSAPVFLLGVSGGIAAYKAADIVSRLKKTGADVHVAMTEAATRFVAPLTFAALSGNRVVCGIFPAEASSTEEAYPHLYPATRAEVFVVAPATADVIARLAQGLGNDAVTVAALSLSPTCRRYFAPTMNVEMWRQAVVQENIRRLEERGWIRIGPESGALACGMTGEGRMSEPADIVAAVMGAGALQPLQGRKVLVLSGPTREYLDPVRYISNASSGKMGKALAETAAQMGARVVMITGPVDDAQLPRASGVVCRMVTSADDLLSEGRNHYPDSDIVVYAAAVADYRPATFQPEKLPKTPGGLSLPLEATPDVAATLNQAKRDGQITLGFALQTHDGEARAKEKLAAKHLDGIVLNAPDALGAESATYRFFPVDGVRQEWGVLSKSTCARRLLDYAASRLTVSGTT